MVLTRKLLPLIALLAVCTPATGQSQDPQAHRGSLTIYVFSKIRIVDAEGTHYRSIGDELGAVMLAPAAAKGTDDDIHLAPDCKATHPSFGSGTFGTTATGFVVRFDNGAHLTFPDLKALWPSLEHCMMDAAKP